MFMNKIVLFGIAAYNLMYSNVGKKLLTRKK